MNSMQNTLAGAKYTEIVLATTSEIFLFYMFYTIKLHNTRKTSGAKE